MTSSAVETPGRQASRSASRSVSAPPASAVMSAARDRRGARASPGPCPARRPRPRRPRGPARGARRPSTRPGRGLARERAAGAAPRCRGRRAFRSTCSSGSASSSRMARSSSISAPLMLHLHLLAAPARDVASGAREPLGDERERRHPHRHHLVVQVLHHARGAGRRPRRAAARGGLGQRPCPPRGCARWRGAARPPCRGSRRAARCARAPCGAALRARDLGRAAAGGRGPRRRSGSASRRLDPGEVRDLRERALERLERLRGLELRPRASCRGCGPPSRSSSAGFDSDDGPRAAELLHDEEAAHAPAPGSSRRSRRRPARGGAAAAGGRGSQAARDGGGRGVATGRRRSARGARRPGRPDGAGAARRGSGRGGRVGEPLLRGAASAVGPQPRRRRPHHRLTARRVAASSRSTALGVEPGRAARNSVDQVLERVRERGDGLELHRRAHPLHAVGVAEERVHGLLLLGAAGAARSRRPGRARTPRGARPPRLTYSPRYSGDPSATALRRRLARRPGPSSRPRARPPRLNGFTMKSLAPGLDGLHHQRLLAERAAHHDHRLRVVRLTISRVASMPLLNGITMSIVVRSGLSSLYFSTASSPFAASPTTSKPPSREDVLDHVPHEDRVVDDQDPLRHRAFLSPGRGDVRRTLITSDVAQPSEPRGGLAARRRSAGSTHA